MKQLELKLRPEIAYQEEQLAQAVKKHIGDLPFSVKRRSIDARKKQVIINLLIEYYPDGVIPESATKSLYKDVRSSLPVIIVGAGPAGLFAALKCLEYGMKPVVVERGKDVRSRRRDLAAINKHQTVNPESNYCFGEGGAGTYSDGKLYTRSKKRGDVNRILKVLVEHGAHPDILIDAHPHIGTNKLPKVIAAIRETIIEFGGEILFESKVVDFLIEWDEMKGVVLENGEQLKGEGVVLATGHSARDIFHLLQQKKVKIEAKPFALGVRVEHPQSLIDKIQYHCDHRGEFLPAAPYSLVSQVNFAQKQRGVFSFCMCPGGFIVPSATAPGEVVVNGMSPSRRDSKYANSGIVFSVDKEDYLPFKEKGELAGMYFQSSIEQAACEVAGGTQQAPAQRLVDFVQKRHSNQLLDTSYQPGIISADLGNVFPHDLVEYLRKGFQDFGKKMKGYLTNEAVVVGVESRTSSPVKIPRDRESLEHVEVKRLFPCAEGAGYAGGIMSAAIDGEKCIESIFNKYFN